jgi:response regulator RpfG family c-di-GMP phosphodiesterase
MFCCEIRPHNFIEFTTIAEILLTTRGYDFMRELRKIEGDGKRIPAIALTGYAGAVDESKALSAGYELHFSNPSTLPNSLRRSPGWRAKHNAPRGELKPCPECY